MRVGDSLDESLITVFSPAKRNRGIPVGVWLDWRQQPFNSGQQVFGAGAQVIPIVMSKGLWGRTCLLRGAKRATSLLAVLSCYVCCVLWY